MFLTVHAATGAYLGQYSPNMLVAFLLGVISHFVLDAIPHGDDELEVWHDTGHYKKVFLVIATDVLLMTTVILGIFTQPTIVEPKLIAAGILGGIIPDFVNAYFLATKSAILQKFGRFHKNIHNWIGKKARNKIAVGKRMGIAGGLIGQILFFWFITRIS